MIFEITETHRFRTKTFYTMPNFYLLIELVFLIRLASSFLTLNLSSQFSRLSTKKPSEIMAETIYYQNGKSKTSLCMYANSFWYLFRFNPSFIGIRFYFLAERFNIKLILVLTKKPAVSKKYRF